MTPKGKFTINGRTVSNEVLDQGTGVIAAALAGSRRLNGMYVLFAESGAVDPVAPAHTTATDSSYYTSPPTGFGAIRIPAVSAASFSGDNDNVLTLYASSAAKTSASYGVAWGANVQVVAFSLASMPAASAPENDLLYNLATLDTPELAAANAELLIKATITC